MNLIKIDEWNLPVYLNLAQAYEAEFSRITNKEPNEKGLYKLDTEWGDPIFGYLLFDDEVPIGACLIKKANRFEVCEFYVIPTRRKRGVGELFVTRIWEKYPGDWEVKQIAGADGAIWFWRATISKFTKGNYKEDQYHDPYWGEVTRQLFSTASQPSFAEAETSAL